MTSTGDYVTTSDDEESFEDEKIIGGSFRNGEFQGRLFKWTNYLHGWQERYLILRHGFLNYYKNELDITLGCRGALSVRQAIIQEKIQHDARIPSKFDQANKSSKTPYEIGSSSPSSSESCSESAKDLITQLTVEHVKNWLRQTRFHHLAATWFTINVNGKELLEISKTGSLTNDTSMLSRYELIQFKDILNRFGFKLELE
ncbi:unnamed protein product [Rotaria sordida]|uniref:PH domain-containing protein n=2 Tax=Rotaria sordida TaxID=392033 RepID=A0A814R5V6_9BILA|nr:unnamed protein product [Rotaria sordida]